MISRSLSSSARRRIAVAMSGGVDSSVAAHLLQKSQHHHANSNHHDDLLGIHMSNWDYHGEDDDDASSSSKCWEQDWKDAKAVAQHLQIPIVHTSFESEYWNEVFEPYCQQLSSSITPNPDIDCNRYIKFGVLKDYLYKRYQIDTLATGHYARLWDPTSTTEMPEYLAQALQQDNEDDSSIMSNLLFHSKNPVLLAARDLSKDQSYFLTGVSGEALRNVLFPLGDYLKSNKNGDDNDDKTVRELALEAQLPNAHKRDSMGICFVGKRKHGSFVDEFIEKAPTNQPPLQCINVETGEAVATFDEPNLSLVYATIGQGAKLSGAAQKWFVVDKPHPRTVVICSGTHHPALYADRLYVQDMNWIVGPPPKLPFRAQCRIRHLQPLVDCEIRPHQDSNSSNHGYEIVLDSPLRGIAPGQVCGIYYNDVVCLGGGAIVQRGPTYWELQKDLPKALHPSGHNDLSSSQQQQLGRRGQ